MSKTDPKSDLHPDAQAVENFLDRQEAALALPNQKARFDDEQLRSINSFEDLASYAASAEEEVYDAADFGTGYTVLEDKDALVGVDFFLIDWRFNAGAMGEFVSMQVLTASGDKWIVNDGSTGIYAWLRKFSDAHGTKLIRFRKGLTRSDYTIPNPSPKPGAPERVPATTYYLSLSR